jgi:endonuclease YncB( thermonuclease family)
MLIAMLLTTALSAPAPTPFVRVKASVQGCHDGDTCRIDVIETAVSVFGTEMTFLHHEVARMCDINAPEVTGTTKLLGEESRKALEKWVKEAKVVEVELPLKDGKAMREKYGRLLVVGS